MRQKTIILMRYKRNWSRSMEQEKMEMIIEKRNCKAIIRKLQKRQKENCLSKKKKY